MTTHRNPVRSVFVTWPKTPVAAEALLKDFQELFDLHAIEIATEKHADGTDHLHAIVQFNNKYSTAHVLKKFKDKYPEDNQRLHVRSVRSLNHAIEYIRKEDPNPVCYGTFEVSNAETLQRARWIADTKRSIIWDKPYSPFYHPLGYDYEDALRAYLSDQSALTNHEKNFSTLSEVYDFYDLLRRTGMTVKEFISVS